MQAETGELLWLPTIEPFPLAHAVAALAEIAMAIRSENGLLARDLAESHVQQATRWLVQTRIAEPPEQM